MVNLNVFHLSHCLCEFGVRLLCKQTALLLHLTSESPGLSKAYSPEAASESLSLHSWMNSRRTKRITQLNFNQGNKVVAWILSLATVIQTGIKINGMDHKG